jgi:hypothetical protein
VREVSGEELDQLYGGELDDFVERRDRMARALKEQGDAAGASAVKAVRKPAATAWAIDRAVREKGAEELLAARAEAEAALARGDGDGYREATKRMRQGIDALVERALAVLEARGQAMSPALRRRVDHTLQTAVIDEKSWEKLRRGWLSEELEPSGFDALAGMALAQAAPKREAPAPFPRVERTKKEVDRLERRADETAKRALEARRAAEKAQREVEKARAAVDEAVERLRAARAEAEKIEDEAAEARKEFLKARS